MIALVFGVYLSQTLASSSPSVVVVNHDTLVQDNSPGPYGTDENQSEIASTVGPQIIGQSPLPAGLVGNVPQIEVSYDNMPFSGDQGSYCWAGIATTNQSNATAERTCNTVVMPTNSTGLPTIAVYPNATISFPFFGQQHPENLEASLFQSGSMTLVKSNASAIGGFALGVLPAGNYVLSINASYGLSYILEYYGIKQIESANYSEGSITISIGSPSVEMKTLSQNLPTGFESVGFPGLEEWPLTISSASVVKDVNLSSISVISGDWVKFLPSYLPEVAQWNGGQYAPRWCGKALRQ